MWGAILGGGMMAYDLYKGHQAEKKKNEYEKKALDMAERQYNERAPLRRQGMQALGQIEAPMDMGNTGFNASNPFAAARGPSRSTASYGDWGRMTTAPEDVDAALGGANPEQLLAGKTALGARYIGKSGGKMRFADASGKQYTNADREAALAQQTRYDQGLGTSRPRLQILGGGR